MVFAETGFRTRAASLLHASSPFRNSTSSLDPPATHSISHNAIKRSSLAADDSEKSMNACKNPSDSASFNEKTLRTSDGGDVTRSEAEQRHLRVVPIWAHLTTDDKDEDDVSKDPSSPLLRSPSCAQIAQHNNSPSARPRHKHEPGHLYDSIREWTPPTPRHHITEYGKRWRSFVDESAQPRKLGPGERIVTPEWLVENGPDYLTPWRPITEEEVLQKKAGRLKRRVWWEDFHRTILRNPMVPLVIRMIVWSFSLAALILGASIFRIFRQNEAQSPSEDQTERQLRDLYGASPAMAIVVDVVALVYILYITYDEYTGKPLGLRSANAKMRLIFLDLFFIVFDSANLSLAFEAIMAGEECKKLGICVQQKGLASVLLVALLAWLMTFAISVLRLIERVVHE